MSTKIPRLTLVVMIGLLGVISAQAGSLEPPPGGVSPTRPPDACFDNTGNRFVDCGDGTIKDTMTGLHWLKDASCLGAMTWADANIAATSLAHGQCDLTDGSLPGDWRLPTLGCADSTCVASDATGELGEILSLAFANGCTLPVVPDTTGSLCWTEGNPFAGVQSNVYWSSSTNASSPSLAWDTILSNGEVRSQSKTNLFFVWPVRVRP